MMDCREMDTISFSALRSSSSKYATRADIDLLKSIEIRPDDPYALNYLAYSWLERNYKIEEAIQMLDKAYLRWLYTAITRATKKLYLIKFNDNFFEI